MHSFRTSLIAAVITGAFLQASPTLHAQEPVPPAYEIGTIPDQRAWFNSEGSVLAFTVTAPTLGDAPTITASWDLANQPDGPLAFDTDTDTLTYSPAATDTEPFKVTFLAVGSGSPIVKEITIQPVQPPEAEAAAFGLAPGAPLPDDTADDKYLQYVESRGTTTQAFNENPSTTTRDVKIMGRTVILEKGHPNGLYEKLHYDASDPDLSSQDIASLEIFADQLIVKDSLHLPQTHVIIHAISMDFVDRDGSTTTISTVPLVPGGDTPPPQNTSNNSIPSADDGLRAGDITLHVHDFQAPGSAVRFILTGGRGRRAAPGKDGASKSNTISCDSKNDYYNKANLLTARVKVLGVWQYTGGSSRFSTIDGWGSTVPSSYWGADAISPGRPGHGGDGGNASANFDLAGLVDTNAGAAGTKAATAHGGNGSRIKGTNGSLYTSGYIYSGVYNAFTKVTTADSGYPRTIYTKDGADKAGPSAIGSGAAGSVTGNATTVPAWVTPEALRDALIFLRDAYLDGHNDFVQDQLAFYLAIIEEARASNGWDQIDSDSQIALDDIANEMQTMLERICSNLDYFGNPAGWVPMLSFEVNYAAFEQEIDRALRLMYLNYWVGGVATTIEEKRTALRETRKDILAQISADRVTYTDAVKEIPGVRVQAEELQQEIDRVVVKIEDLEDEALKKAKNTVAAKRAARVLGKIAQSFPVGQPALGAAGGALAASTEIDPNRSFAENAIVVGQGAAGGFAAGNAAGKAGAAQSQAAAINVENGDQPADPATEAALRDANKELLQLMKDTGQTLLTSKASDPEIAAELERILAENPVYRSLSARLDKLNARKRDFANQIAQLLQSITVLPLQIAHNLRVIAQLNTSIASEADKVDAATVSYLKDIDGRARARLLKYHYYMARAYAYRRLQSYPGTLNLGDIFNKIVTLAGANGAVLDSTDFADLKGVYEDQLSTVADLILADANQTPPEQSISVVFNLPQSVIDQLNAGEVARLNLRDLNLFPTSEENLRITNLVVTAMDVTVDPSAPAPNAFSLVFKHSGISELQRDGQTFLFRHYSESTRSAITWKTVKQFAGGGGLVSTVPSAASASLIGTLVGKAPSEILVYSRPAVYADLLISTEVNTPGAKVHVNGATVRVSYDYTARSEFIKSVKIATAANGIAPGIEVSSPDRNDRGDGLGEFERVYDRNAVVTLTAPETFGEFKFVRWEGATSNPTSRSTTVTLSDNVTLIPVYESTVQLALTVSGGSGSGLYTPGDLAPISAQNQAGKKFVRWEGEGLQDPTAAQTAVLMSDDTSVTAIYESLGGFSSLVNISNRAVVGNDANILIAGFYIGGNTPKKVLARVVGDTLSQDPYNVPGTLADPKITIYSGQTVVATNDNWEDNSNPAEIADAMQAAGAFPLASGSRDAALLISLPPGGYTVQAAGINGATGVALLELYDADQSGSTSELKNISGRADVGEGSDILIAGFVVVGSQPQKVLVRAVGPTLKDAPFNLPGTMDDPLLTIYKGQTVIASNDDWSTETNAAEVATTSGTVGAFALPSGSKDAAMLLTLEPGLYTAQVSGVNGATGVAVVEVYAVD